MNDGNRLSNKKNEQIQRENVKLQRSVLSKEVKGTKIWHYLATAILIISITLVNKLLDPYFDLANIALLYLLPVLFSAVNWGYGPSVMASLLGVLSFDVFFVPPHFSITVHDLRYLLSFAIFLLVAITTSTTAVKLKNQVNLARIRENRTAALYSLSRKIVAEPDIEGIFKAAVKMIANTIDGRAAILTPNENEELKVSASTEQMFNNYDKGKVEWVYKHGETAGKGTETFSDSDTFYLPIKSEQQNIGVLSVQLGAREEFFTLEQKRLLEAFANLVAIAIVRLRLAEEAQQAHYLAQSEKLRTALFNSVSHEIRTPLASIIGAITSLLDQWDIYTRKDKQSLLQTMNESALRMDRLVKNLLDMARLESGRLELKLEWCDIQDILGVALRRAKKTVNRHSLTVSANYELPLVKADFTLIEQVLINLIDNAAKYSPPGTGIAVEMKCDGKEIMVSVIDQGTVIPLEERKKIFDKFYRSYYPNKKTEGTGLGLSICKGIIDAHDGRIWAEPRNGGGNQFLFTLPLSESVPADLPLEVGEENVR
ncbi:DUF4118 domain-containing protein [Metallumcola ferriviriculae]|uniref:histidine kinase n=1 Tax=Metallumcola ferriviriculae TaxID=3039180 RepID=A0AAU0UJQ4_9FIRM|nr:DUF4118 domain-containing protein [Desulfitibacteraceae bacterium MK1]